MTTIELDLDKRVFLLGQNGAVYHEWRRCNGRPNRWGATVTWEGPLGDLLDSSPSGKYGPCLRCLHGKAPIRVAS